MDEYVILDFETTGLSPDYARIIEVGAIIVKDDERLGSFSELMHPGCSVPYFITTITGITNQMLRGKPSPATIMPKLFEFIGNRPILAHNAPFDQKFLVAEMARAGIKITNDFLCTLKLSRRLLLTAPDHKLTTLVSHLKINVPKEHRAHRALNDVMMTFEVWLHLKQLVAKHIKTMPSFEVFDKLSAQPKAKTMKVLDSYLIKVS